MKTRPILGLLTASLLIAAGLHAAEPAQTKTMLVLDASGSMWGQIGGKTKIAIAREAVDSMLDGWNGGDLGLIAYGHRRKGDCADIEVLQAIGPDTAAGIRKQVNALNPKGMTPITASVRMAAEQLRFTEQKATVILVSDGEDLSTAGLLPTAKIPVGPGFQTEFAERVRHEADLPVAAVGMITSPAQADHIVRSGQADMVLLGRELLRNPYWPLAAARELGQPASWPKQYLRAAPAGSTGR